MNMTKIIFVVAMLLSMSQFMMAQNKTIIGTIVDSETKESVFGAVITMGAPNFEHSIAVALPIPEDAPVTKIVLFSKLYGL